MSKANESNSTASRIVGGVGLGLLGLAAAASLTAGALTVVMARTVVTPPRRADENIRVFAITDRTITLSADKDSLTPGRYSLWFDAAAGHARIGEILSMDAHTVTRELIAIDYGELKPGSRGRFSGWFYLSPRQLGFPYEEVSIPTPVGDAPAWYVPAEGESERWVIQVHGRAVRKGETLRAVPVFREAGYNSLLISYRNDGDAPASDDNRYALGDLEWHDVDAAIQYAIDRGAVEIVLMGWSMGGATVLQAATRSANAHAISGIVLDSPVIDWRSVLDFQGGLARLPRVIRQLAIAAISKPWGTWLTGQTVSIDLDRLDFVTRAAELSQPILLLHSTDDGYVPSDASRALAAARPDIVTFDEFSTARHVKLWNYDEPRWRASISGWLATSVASGGGQASSQRA